MTPFGDNPTDASLLAERFRVTLDSIGDAVIVTDDTGIVTFLNPVASKLTGWGVEDALGKPVTDIFYIVNETTRELVPNPVAEVIASGRVAGLANHTVLVARDGHETPIDDSAAPIVASEKSLAGVVLVFRDISERRQIEAALEASERRFRALIEHSNDAITLIKPDGTVLYASASTEQVLGYTPDEFLNLDLTTIRHPDNPPTDPKLLNRLMTVPGAAATTIGRNLHKDGSWRWLESTVTNMLEEPAVEAFVANYHDITALKQTEAEVAALLERERQARIQAEASEARYRSLFEGSADAILVLDGDGHYIDVNPAASALYGYTREEFLALSVGALSPEPMSTVKHWERASLMQPGQIYRAEAVILHKNGQLLQVEGTTRVVELPSGRGYVTSARDLSERRQAEADARALEEERHARTLAEETVKERDRFLGTVAHELRTPVTGITGFVGLLERASAAGPLPPEQLKRYTAAIATGAVRLTNLTNDLLNIARLQQGSVALRRSLIDLSEVAAQAARPMEDLLRSGQHLTLTLNPAPVLGDPDRLDQVVTNLLENASKYSAPDGTIHLEVWQDGDAVLLSVTDTGIGLPPGADATIFEPFRRATNAIDGQIPGLGLGLYICRQIVEAHGGTIAAHSAGEQQGTQVKVRLPALT